MIGKVFIYANLEFVLEGVYEATKYEITLYSQVYNGNATTSQIGSTIPGVFSSYVENGVTKYYRIPATLKIRKGMTIAQSLKLFPNDNTEIEYREDMFKNACISSSWTYYNSNLNYVLNKWKVNKGDNPAEVVTTIDINQQLTSNMKFTAIFHAYNK